MSVAHGRPSSSAATAGVRVRMSWTTTSGANATIVGRVDATDLTTAS